MHANGLNVSQLAGVIKSKIGYDLVRCDSEDPRMINELRMKGVNAIAAGARVKGRGAVSQSTRWLASKHMIVDKRCRGLINELSSLKWKEDKYGDPLPEIDEESKRRKHGTDAVRYGLEPLIGMARAKAY